MNRSKPLLAAVVAVACFSAANATPYPHGRISAVDIGSAGSFAENAQVTLTVVLNLRNRDELEELVQSVYTRGNPAYHQFLTPQQFRNQFGPTAATIATVTQHFQSQGLDVSQTAAAQLHVTGSAAAIEKAFDVKLHAFEVAATGSQPPYAYPASFV